MSKKIYWGVMQQGSWGKDAAFPRRFHSTARRAKDECREKNVDERGFKRPKYFFVMRFILDFKDKIHYDVYKHEVKRI